MHCSDARNLFDDYLDGDIPPGPLWDLRRHVSDCAACRLELEQARAVQASLSHLPMQGPSEGFFDRVFDGLSEADPRETAQHRSGDAQSWFGRRNVAIAAVFALIVATAVVVQQSSPGAPSSEIPEVTIAMDEVTSVNLVFTTEVALQDVRLTLQLPSGIELAGYNGRSSLSWTTDLESGKNVLRLPLVGHIASVDEITATLEHAQGTKTFQLKVNVI